ncbi:integrin alpha-L isoform X2 [Carettochelys insculpta]
MTAPTSEMQLLLTALMASNLLQGPAPAQAFSIETHNATVFEGDAEAQFGYRVVPVHSNGSSWLVVSAPLGGNGTGSLYRCSYHGGTCQPIPLPETPPVSMGLVLASDESSGSRIIACGPRLQQPCEENVYLQGLCYLWGGLERLPRALHPTSQECISGVDVAILYDDSQSIQPQDFTLMKTFIEQLLRNLAGPRAQLAVVQFSSEIHQVFSFTSYTKKGLSAVVQDLMAFPQLKGNTHTPSAIRFVAQETFGPQHGARPKAKRLLIVLTDGESTDEQTTFAEAIQAADSKELIRYAIGVGNAFSAAQARQELLTIASRAENVFRVGSFAALSTLQEQLREKIFNIEGTGQVSNSSSFQLELSQGGFSALLTPEVVVVGAVGAYDWAGGLEEQDDRLPPAFLNESALGAEAKDAYLGYAVALARRGHHVLYVTGAPRFGHVGRVSVFQSRRGRVGNSVLGEQVGSSFGAELCTLDLDGDGNTDLVLIGAPNHQNRSRGGLVRVCALGDLGSLNCTQTLWGSPGDGLGRFGAAVGPLGDVNGDNTSDVAIGAPMEDEGRGAIYIFLGNMGRPALKEPHSQRISARSLSLALRFFGQSVQGRMDLSGDGLTDVVVGALGRAVLLRTRPVISVSCSLSLVPTHIPLGETGCMGASSRAARQVALTLCFNLSHISQWGPVPLRARLSLTLQMDAGSSNPRLVLQDGTSRLLETLRLSAMPHCATKSLHVRPCLEDFLTPVELQVNFSVRGEPISGMKNLTPVLAPNTNTTTRLLVPFEKKCGADEVCVADLRVSFNFSGAPGLRLSSSFLLNLTVQLENVGETAYGPALALQYPPGLSFRGGAVLRSPWPVALVCSTPLALSPLPVLNSSCQLSPPALRERTAVVLRLALLVSSDAPWADDLASFTLQAACRNENETLADNVATRELPVLRPVGIVVTGLDSSTYVNVSAELPERRAITHGYQVRNLGPLAVPITVTFDLPIRAELGFLWDVAINLSGGEKPFTCTPPQTRRMGTAAATPKEPVTRGCLGATVCTQVQCQVTSLANGEVLRFYFSGELYRAKDGAKLEAQRLWLRSEAAVSIDETKYFQSQPEEFQYSQVTTEVEVISHFNPVPVIVGSSVGGVVLLLVLVGLLYKFGFFKRNRLMGPEETPGGETVSATHQGNGAPPEPPTAQGPPDPQGTA